MKTALINPRMFIHGYQFFPIGLGYLAGALEKENIQYRFIDLHLDWVKTQDFINEIKRNKIPDLFAITGLLTSFQSIKELTNAIKTNFSESKIVLGGRISVIDPDLLFKLIPIDFVIQGEGESAFVQMIHELEKGNKYPLVKGLSFRKEDGTIFSNGETKPLENISDFSIPYTRLNMRKYIQNCNIQSPNVLSLNILSSRGCPFTCTFCNNSKEKRKVRFYAKEQISKSLDYLIHNFGLKHVTFNDDIFTFNKNHMKAVCSCLKERKLSFSISTRLDFLDEETIHLLDESGCYYLCLGIESPAPSVAKIIDKKLDLQKLEKNISILKKSRIITNYGFMIGYLGETEETIKETREFVLRNKIIYSAFFATAFPKTKLYDMVKNKIHNEEEYLKRLFKVDLSRDYLINMTNMPKKRVYRLRDELIAESLLHTLNIKFPLLKSILWHCAIFYLIFMRKFGLNIGILKRLFEFINMSVIKPLTVKKSK